MRTAKKLACAACGRRIREHQPDLVLENVAGGRARFYHTSCGKAACAAAAKRPGAYLLSIRHVDPATN